jgi:hypothetical protein
MTAYQSLDANQASVAIILPEYLCRRLCGVKSRSLRVLLDDIGHELCMTLPVFNGKDLFIEGQATISHHLTTFPRLNDARAITMLESLSLFWCDEPEMCFRGSV